jgi:hypothetical protein
VEGEEKGRILAPREKAPPSGAAVLGLHVGVFVAEAVLASAIVGLFVGLPLYGLGRLLGVF